MEGLLEELLQALDHGAKREPLAAQLVGDLQAACTALSTRAELGQPRGRGEEKGEMEDCEAAGRRWCSPRFPPNPVR